ncbi:MAG: glycosyltransferase [Verrucomicrobiales bacterium]|nr:glycosyltransferase [Verrucomicrobiales bacterium]
MKKKPLISILLPARNAEKTLPLAIESCLAQTQPDFELVLVDHRSTDKTFSLMKKYVKRDSRVRVARAPAGSTFVQALNFCTREADGDLLVRMDADDFSYADRLQCQLRYMQQHPEVGVCGALVRIRLRQSDMSATEPLPGYADYEKWLNSLVSPEQVAQQRYIDSPIANPTAMIRREVMEKAGGYKEVEWAEDYDLWLRMLQSGVKIGKVDRVLLDWYDSDSRVTRTSQRYSQDNFLKAKAFYLSRELLVEERGVSVAGAGRIGKKLARWLKEFGVKVHCFFEVNERQVGNKIGGIEVKGEDCMDEAKGTVLIAAVGVEGAREIIRGRARRVGFVEGEDFFCVA